MDKAILKAYVYMVRAVSVKAPITDKALTVQAISEHTGLTESKTIELIKELHNWEIRNGLKPMASMVKDGNGIFVIGPDIPENIREELFSGTLKTYEELDTIEV